MRGATFQQILRLGGVLLFAAVATASSQTEDPDLAEALGTAKEDLEEALAKLAEVRQTIAAEKPALAEEFAASELELREKRRLARLARMSRGDREETLRQLERDRAVRKQDAAYLAGLLKDHALKIGAVSGPGEPPLQLDPAMLAREATDPAAALTERLAVVDASLDRLEELLGGSTAPGKVTSSTGAVLEGRFAAAGPAVWFAGDEAAGDVSFVKGAPLPRLWSSGDDEVRTLLAGGEAVVAVDVASGKARALEEIRGGLLDYVRKGGVWIWPILALALFATVIGIIKLLGFLRYREPREALVTAILAALRTGDRDKAAELADGVNHPAGPVLAKLLEQADTSSEAVEETLYEQLMGVEREATSLLAVLAVTAATAPLLGLLGTVSGMIRTFNLITLFGSGDPKPLAGGISEALVTTLFGLAVAIPALILHAFLSRRSQGIVQTTERLGLSFVNGLRN